jgi:hypothetical protein
LPPPPPPRQVPRSARLQPRRPREPPACGGRGGVAGVGVGAESERAVLDVNGGSATTVRPAMATRNAGSCRSSRTRPAPAPLPRPPHTDRPVGPTGPVAVGCTCAGSHGCRQARARIRNPKSTRAYRIRRAHARPPRAGAAPSDLSAAPRTRGGRRRAGRRSAGSGTRG